VYRHEPGLFSSLSYRFLGPPLMIVTLKFLSSLFLFPPLRDHTQFPYGHQVPLLQSEKSTVVLYFNSARTPCVDDGFRIQKSRRQRGQEACLTSQQSMHGTWKTCRHPGSRLAGSPTRKSCRHTEQPSASPAASTAVSSAISISGSWMSASAGRPLPPPVSNRSVVVSANGELMALICSYRPIELV
jgi:hypothetical protein